MERRKFSREFKLEAVKLVSERGVAVAQAARDLDLHENVLHKSRRGGSVCLNSCWGLTKWISALVMPLPGSASAH
jgi:hypothetical protein